MSELKKANIKKNKSRLNSKRNRRKTEKYGNKTPIELRKPVTFYDRRAQLKVEKEMEHKQWELKQEEKRKIRSEKIKAQRNRRSKFSLLVSEFSSI